MVKELLLTVLLTKVFVEHVVLVLVEGIPLKIL
jgi:hypothetical protein